MYGVHGMIIRMVGMPRFIGDLRNLLTLYDLGDMDPNLGRSLL
jgi:hypothetical protein